MAVENNKLGSLTVTNQAELDSAFKTLAATTGGTILLEAGTEYSLVLRDWQDEQTDAAVTIRSADPDARATIKQVTLTGRENVTIQDTILYTTKDELKTYQPLVSIKNSENITLRNNEMASNAEGAAGTEIEHTRGATLGTIRDSENVTFEDNTIKGFMHGLTLRDTHDTRIVGNEFSELQGDGIRLAGASGVEIEGNHFHSFLGTPWATNHPDVIQLWGTNIKVNNEDINIRENILDMSGAAAYQMIFGHNEHRETNGLQFTNITIEHNVLYGAHTHMISLSDTLGATVRNNTAIHSQDSYFVGVDGTRTISDQAGMITVEGEDTTVEHNIGHNVSNTGENTVLTIGDSGAATDYVNHFINIEAGGSGDLRDITLRSDSELNGEVGSHLTWYSDTTDELRAIADVEFVQGDNSMVVLNAELSQTPGDAPVEYIWSFEDGTVKTGASLEHDFGTSGLHEYTLTVRAQDGVEDTITRSINIESAITLELVVENDQVSETDASAATLDAYDTLTVNDGWIAIGGDAERLSVSRSTEELFSLSSFNYELTLNSEIGQKGLFLHQHKTLEAGIEADGRVSLKLLTDEGRFDLTTQEALFADAGAHHLNVVYDDAAQKLTIYADGLEVGSTFAEGTTASKEFWGLTIGGNWGKSLEAEVQNVRLSAEAKLQLEDVLQFTFEGASQEDSEHAVAVLPEHSCHMMPDTTTNTSLLSKEQRYEDLDVEILQYDIGAQDTFL